jgi:hypothetical protein
MDKSPDYSALALQNDMEETRRSMTRTLGEIRQEVVEGLAWQNYVKRYPAAALMAAAGLGWIIGRQLKKPSSVSSFNGLHSGQVPPQGAYSSGFSKIGEKIVSLVSSEILALLALQLKDFLSSRRPNPPPHNQNLPM